MTERAAMLAIDPSTIRLGLALADLETADPIRCWSDVIRLDTKATWRAALESGDVGLSIGAVLGLAEGHAHRAGAFVATVWVESPIHGGLGRPTVWAFGGAVALITEHARRRWPGVTINLVEPAEYRPAAGLPGGGRCSKAMVVDHARKLGWDVPQRPATRGRMVDDEDAADAAVLAAAGCLINAVGEYGEAA